MARILFEVLSGSLESSNFPRKDGTKEEVEFWQFNGVDVDYFDQMFKVKIYRLEQKAIERFQQVKKGERLNIKFRSMKPPTQFEKSTVLNVSENDVEFFDNDGRVEEESEVQNVQQEAGL